jgi:hypothetical protein
MAKHKDKRPKSVRRGMQIPQLIDQLLVQESIIRGMPINSVIIDILNNHFSQNTLQMKYLKAILTELTKRKGSCISDELLNINSFDKLLIAESEIEASRFRRPKKYIKKKPKEEHKTFEPKVSIFQLDTIKKPT